jgi:hypothetical protein
MLLGGDALGRLVLGQIGADAAAPVVVPGEDTWHQPFHTDIVRQRTFKTAHQQFSALVQFAPFTERVTADRWFVPFSEPVRFPRQLPSCAIVLSLVLAQLKRFSADRWAQALSERCDRAVHTCAHQFASFVQCAPFAREPPMSEPVRFKPRLPTHAQQFASFVQFAPFYETVSADRWFVPFSEPVRFRPRLITANQVFSFREEIPISGELNTISATLARQSDHVTGVPTSNYKQLLSDTTSRILYTAVISPWSVSDRNA